MLRSALRNTEAMRISFASWHRNHGTCTAATSFMAQDETTRERFTLDQRTINPNLKKVQYAVRGPVLDRAMEIEHDLTQVRHAPARWRRPMSLVRYS